MQINMKALRPFWNPEHEGDIQDGQTFRTTEARARALEVRKLATRVVATGPMQIKSEIPPRPLVVMPRLGAVEYLSSSPRGQVQPEKTSEPSDKRKKRLSLPSFASMSRGD